MRILLDTHVFLWFCIGDKRISDAARKRIEDTSIQPLLSIASIWEMVIKLSLGKLRLNQPYEMLIPELMQKNGIDLLQIEMEHFFPLHQMPFHHRDPFDRRLISQSISEQIPLLSAYTTFDLYPIKRIW